MEAERTRRVWIRPGTPYESIARYVVELVGRTCGIRWDFVSASNSADLVIDHLRPESIPLRTEIYDALKSKVGLPHTSVFDDQPLIRVRDGRVDDIATIFYMVNCVQESSAESDAFDSFGRFRYDASYQSRFDCCEDNLVQKRIDHLVSDLGVEPRRVASRVFLSHDIDELYGSFLQDGFWAVRNVRPGALFRIVWRSIIGRPLWRNVDEIVRFHEVRGLKSTFFWLVESGEADGIRNADYDIVDERRLIHHAEAHGFSNGLHKSSSALSLDEELQRLPVPSRCNRYHFLRFSTAGDWIDLHRSDIVLDASLGFAERIGFRNSFGMPFKPWNPETESTFDFVEVPLHVMDRTLGSYMNLDESRILDTLISFVDRHQQDCILSILWHNNCFTDYKYGSFRQPYGRLLDHLIGSGWRFTTPEEILETWRT